MGNDNRHVAETSLNLERYINFKKFTITFSVYVDNKISVIR